MKNFLKFLLSFLVLGCIILIVSHPEIFVPCALDGLKLWAITVVPSLLPFFFLTALLSQLGFINGLSKLLQKPFEKLFKVDGVCAFAFLTSIFSGYPIGAKTISDLCKNGYIDKDQATRASTFCSTSGPLFIIGCVGLSLFNNKKIGYLILICHLISTVFCGLIFRFYGDYTPLKKVKNTLKCSTNPLYDSVYSSVISILLVGGFICIFSVFAKASEICLILKTISLPLSKFFTKDLSNAFSLGLIECTQGLKLLSNCNLSTYSVAFASALISFGGISVWAQSIIFLCEINVDVKIFCFSKILQAIFSFLLTLLLFPIFSL